MKRKRVNHYFDQTQLERLKVLSLRTGVPVSEIIRRAIEVRLELEGLGVPKCP